MFREMLRKKQQLSQAECVQLLKSELRGVLSLQGDDGYPYALPIDHYYCEEDGRLYFHCGRFGHKLDAIRRCDKACFCLYDGGCKSAGEWALTIRSVIVFGRMEIIEDRDTVYRIARALSHKFTQDEDYIRDEIDRSGPATLLLALKIEHMTGKRVREA